MAEHTSATAPTSELEARIVAFDLARREDSTVPLGNFLPAPDHPAYADVLRELVRRDLRSRLRSGESVRLESYRAAFPLLFDRTDLLGDLAFEEYCQLVLTGTAVTPTDYSERYRLDVSGWPAPGEVTPRLNPTSVLALARELNLPLGDENDLDAPGTFTLRRLARARDRMPQPGESILDFDILRELGRGAFSRVYLARQRHLAGRSVVLKISAQLDEEPWTLGELQHTNIVPIYSVHQSGSLQVECMPYFGSLTLAQVIDRLSHEAVRLPATGRELLRDLFEAPAPVDQATVETPRPGAVNVREMVPHSNAARDAVTRMTHVNAALWIAARLADGLAHAHDRGILHSDLKPANVLITDDGQPMLLDFNVSVDTKLPPELQAARVGGTLPYMAPEHLAASRDPQLKIDARCDLYSLGVILYRLLTGRPPFPPIQVAERDLLEALRQQRMALPAPPSRFNPVVTPAVDSVVRKLLEPDPGHRYASATQLREDLDRQLSDRPLRFARDPSLVERMRKWRRRNPRLATALGVTAAAFIFLALPGLALAMRQDQINRQARQAERSQALEQQREAVNELRTAAMLLSSREGGQALRDQGADRGRRVLERYGVAAGPDWRRQPMFAALGADHQRELGEQFGEVLLLLANREIRRGGSGAGERALQFNRLAGDCFPADRRPHLLARQRAELTGQPPPADDAESSDLNLYYDGLALAVQSRYGAALEKLIPFTDRRPEHFMGWFARGLSHAGAAQLSDADTAFTVGISQQPGFPHLYFNRGLVRLKQQRYRTAESDFGRALALESSWDLGSLKTSALINRALAREGQRDYVGAERDLTVALAEPNAPTRIYFLRAKVRRTAGNTAGAAADRAAGLAHTPTDAASWSARGAYLMADDPQRALGDFEQALQMDPRAWEAMQNKAMILADHLHRTAEAVAVLDQLLEQHPHFVGARGGRGVYLARLGQVARAKRDAADCLRQDQSAFLFYQLAGLYAQLSRHGDAEQNRAESLKMLAKAFRAGFERFDLIPGDTDLDPVRNQPEFGRLIESARILKKN
ncbi:MAG: protein kinase domain-containing protein [Gemmataceae bacterium]